MKHFAHRLHVRSFSAAPPTDRPLSGVKVLDLSRILAGPFATMMLSDLGADVIKVENPKRGDDTRTWLPPHAPNIPQAPRPDLPPESAYFLQANRNKRSITVNMKSPSGQAVIRRLAANSDVLVENYLPGKLDKYGLAYHQLIGDNPGLIYCSVTGYGSTGPYSSYPGYDVAIEAEAGLMHITGERMGQPVKVGVAVTDILTGHYAQSAVLAALLHRERTGKGKKIECSLFESQIASLANIASNYLIAGQEASRWGTEHPSIVPYQVFRTKDSFLMLSAGNDTQWATLAGILGIDDPCYATNAERVDRREELVRLIEQRTIGNTTSEWVKALQGKGMPFAPINNIAQTFDHPQAKARQVVEEVDHPRAGRIKLPAAAVTYDGQKPKAYRAPPYLGQHTSEILTELGLDEATLRAEGAI